MNKNINFLEYVKNYEKDAILNLQKILKIDSVLDEETISEGAPFGKGIKECLEVFLDMAKNDGFKTFNDEGYAGVVEYGDGEEKVAVLCHLDVVPTGNNWRYPPFSATIEDGKIYARGAMDDKGPTMAAYYALKILKDLNIKLNKKIQLILGTDEETGWRGIAHYKEKYGLPEIGFAPDADFPLIYGEKGILNTIVENHDVDDDIVYIKGGERFNVVIDLAEAATLKDHQDDFNKYLKDNNLSGTCNLKDGLYVYEITGTSAHAMEPFKGINAGTHMLNFLSMYSNNGLVKLGAALHNDHFLEKAALAYTHEEMGELTCNIGIIKFEKGQNMLTLDMRCPIGFDLENFEKTLNEWSKMYNLECKIVANKAPHYIEPTDPLVTTLYQAYVKYTNDTVNKPHTIGGGTYARAIKKGVAFGMEMPGAVTVAHQPNEYLVIKDFLTCIAIYAEAMYELGK
ncbi:MAG: dipeptidase PepV [Bacilli bacterium]|nr:dipeptidase PepV [Bacilli bacterium]